MLEETADREEIIARVAALDIGKAEVVCCVRVPREGRPGRRLQEVQTYSAMTRSLLGMADRLRSLGVTRVVMEATSDYWKPAFYVLEAAGFETWLVNAKDVKAGPGQARRGLAVQGRRAADDPSQFRAAAADPPAAGCDPVPDRPGRGADRGENRAEKLLEDAGIKLSVVASDIFGVSGRAMMAALIAGERSPVVLAQLARTRMRARIPALQEAFTGHFTSHHAFLLAKMLARVDAIDADIAELDARIVEMIVPFAVAADRLDEIPGIGPVAAAIIIAEIGTDMTRFPTAGHLAS